MDGASMGMRRVVGLGRVPSIDVWGKVERSPLCLHVMSDWTCSCGGLQGSHRPFSFLRLFGGGQNDGHRTVTTRVSDLRQSNLHVFLIFITRHC